VSGRRIESPEDAAPSKLDEVTWRWPKRMPEVREYDADGVGCSWMAAVIRFLRQLKGSNVFLGTARPDCVSHRHWRALIRQSAPNSGPCFL